MCKPEDCLKCRQGRDCPNEEWPYSAKSAMLALAIVALIGALSLITAFGRYAGHPW